MVGDGFVPDSPPHVHHLKLQPLLLAVRPQGREHLTSQLVALLDKVWGVRVRVRVTVRVRGVLELELGLVLELGL